MLETAQDISRAVNTMIDKRSADYGDPVVFWRAVAVRWSRILGSRVLASQAVDLMIAMKQLRLAVVARETPVYDDTLLDIACYASIGQMCVERLREELAATGKADQSS